MQYHLSQAELIEAMEYYLNKVVLKRHVKVTKVEPQTKEQIGINYTLHVTVSDDDSHVGRAADAE